MTITHESVEGYNRITADILDRSDNKVGPGPLMTCLGLEYDSLLSQAGHFTARFPANDPRLDYVQLKKHFLAFYVDGAIVCYGLTESWSHEIADDGQRIAIISGRDSLAELGETSVNFLEMVFIADPVTDAPGRIITAYNFLGTGEFWIGIGTHDTETPVYGSFAGELALDALIKVAEHIGEAFRLLERRGIEWLGTTTESSGVRAIQGAGDAIAAEDNLNVCFIQRLTERRDASRMITKVYPYGAGLGETRLDLRGTSRVAPAGFTYNEADNSISSDAALTYIGKTIARHVNFKDIRPLYNTTADIQSAKDYLFDSALAYLQRNDDVDDVVEYDLDVLQLPARVRVGMTIRVIYADDNYSLDTDLVILGIRTSVGTDGGRKYSLTVSPINQWRIRESSAIVSQMEEGEIFAAHPQIDGNSYWENFRVEVGDDQIEHMAEMPFILGAEVVTVRQVVFRYKVEPVLGMIATYALADTNTEQNVLSDTGPSSRDVTEQSDTTDTDASSRDITELNPTGTDIIFGAQTPTDTVATIDFIAGGTRTGPPSADVPHWHDLNHYHPFSHTHGDTELPQHNHGVEHTHPIPHNHDVRHIHTSPQHVHGLPDLNVTYALQRVPALNSYIQGDLEYSVNGGTWFGLEGGIPVAGGYFELDLTPDVQDPSNLRPLQEDNLVQIRRKISAGAGKSAQIHAKLGVRITIQSIAIFS